MSGNTLDAEATPPAPRTWRPTWPRSWRRVALVLVLLSLCALQLRAVLRSGYSNDDVANSQIPMQTTAYGRSVVGYWADQTRFWREQHGRFIPISGLETIVVFTLLSARHAYKVFQVVAAVVALGVFVGFVRRLTGELWAALVAGLVAVACMQVRAWNDPWLQYNAQQPTALVLVLGAFGGYLAFARTGRVRWLAAALVPWTLVLMLYETTWAFLLLFPLVGLGAPTSRRTRLVGWGVLFVPVLVLGLYIAGLRADATGDTASYTTNLAPAAVAEALVEQVGSALPLTYGVLGPDSQHVARPWSSDALIPDLADVLVAAGAAALVAASWPRLGALGRDVRWQLAGLGAAFAVLPAGVVATTVRWQQELTPGLGYVSVYVQTFGVALLTVAGLAWWRSRRLAGPPRALVGVAAVGAAVVLVVTQHTSSVAVDQLQSLRWDREVLADAIDGGLLADVADDEGVLSLRAQGWIDPAFLRWYGGPSGAFQFEPPAGCRPLRLDCLEGGGLQWALTPEYGASATTGHVTLGHLDATTDPALGPQAVLSRELRVWVRSPDAGDDRSAPVLRVAASATPDQLPTPRSTRPDEVTVVDQGDGWWLLRVVPDDGALLDVGSLDVARA